MEISQIYFREETDADQRYFVLQHQLICFNNRDGVFTAPYGLDIYI
jgi:hypothetical protein